jgi:UDP-3-O-[3-hydroxymyristoyl] glucosamine N-acyltransferase
MDAKKITIAELAKLTGSTVVGDSTHVILGVADLESATPQDAAFFANLRYEKHLRESAAGVVFVDHSAPLLPNRNYLLTKSPSDTFQQAIEFFYENADQLTAFDSIHPTAVIHPTCKIGSGVIIGPHAVLDAGVSVGDHTSVGAGCYIGPYTSIGSDSLLHPNVTIRERCRIGNRVILQPGVIIGSCGYGYTQNARGQHTKLKQLGDVVIEDDVEIGANSTVDRARFKTTRIGRGTKIDNLVQIGHGVEIGEHNLIIAQTGIAGSTKTGRYVIIAGQVAVAGHLHIADQVVIAGRSGVTKSLTEVGKKYGGIPAVPLPEYNRTCVYIKNLQTYVDQIKDIEKRLKKIGA